MESVTEYLKKVYAQLRDLFLSMTPGNRVVASLLLLTLIVSLGFLVVGGIQRNTPDPYYTVLYDGRDFTSNEKQAVEDALYKAGLTDFDWIGNKLRVPQKASASYAAAISSEKAISQRGITRLTTVNGFSPWEGSKAMDAKWFEAKADDLAQEIAKFPGIASASVIPDKQKKWSRNVLAREDVFSVAVNIGTVQNKPLPDDTISAIGELVAAAFGTETKQVRIVDRQNSKSYNGKGEELTGGGGDYLKQQARYQEYWNNRIYEFLPHIQGLQVETSVELTKLINERFLEVQHDKPTLLTEHVLGYNFEKTGYDRFGRPGPIAQYGRPLIDPQGNISDQAKTTENKHEAEKSNALPGRETNAEVIPYTPTQILASIRIPDKHVLESWIAKNTQDGEAPPVPTPEDITAEKTLIEQETKELVSQLLLPWWNAKKTPDPLELVKVKFYPLPQEKEIVLTAWQQFLAWMSENWQSVSLMGLVLCGLGVLWAITRPTKPEPIVIYEAPEIPMEVIEARAKAKAEEEAAALAAAEEELEAERTLAGFSKNIRSLQEEVAELVSENPDAAAAVLRQWIGNAVLVEQPM